MNWELKDRTEEALLLRAVGVKRGEGRLVFWSCAQYFFLMAGYYVVRPIRDTMGLSGGAEELTWLFLLTLVAMLVVNPVFAALVSRFPRRVFVPAVYGCFLLNLLVFFLIFCSGVQEEYLARTFFVLESVFSLFVVSVFWALMADLFQSEQAARLFGLIGVGGTLGAITGAATTAMLAARIGEMNLLPLAAMSLLAACLCTVQTRPQPSIPSTQSVKQEPTLGGGVLAGITHAASSPYLFGIVLFSFFHGLSGTFAYLVQGRIVQDAISHHDARTSLFASMDVLSNVLAAPIQILLTGRVIKVLGIGRTLVLLPVVLIVGFLGLGLMPGLALLFALQVVSRATDFALARPARESLFTVLPREDKYKAKSFIDTFVYRSGDTAGAIGFLALTSSGLGLGMPGVLLIASAGTICWVPVAFFLGRRQRAMAAPTT